MPQKIFAKRPKICYNESIFRQGKTTTMENLIEYRTAQKFEMDATLPLCVHNAGHYYITMQEYPTNRKNGRPDYQLIYLKSGKMCITIDGVQKELSGGSLIIFKPRQPQIYSYLCCEPCDAYWVHFYGTMIPEMLKQLKLDGSTLFYIGENYRIPQYINAILIALIAQKFSSFSTCLGNFLLLLSELSDVKNRTDLNEKEHFTREKFSEVLLQMHNSSSIVNIEEYAKMCNLSISRFSHLFKKTFGVSPYAYKTKIKLERAKLFLTEYNYSIKEISEFLGYNDALYFSRIFKKYTGLSPQSFRKKMHFPNGDN